MGAIDWKALIQIDNSWHSNILNHQFTEMKGKVTVCLHSISASGTQFRSDALVGKLAQLIPLYTLGKNRIRQIEDPMEISFKATQYFGNIPPDRDGKYGELLLFALVESMLGCKMVAHKVRALTSMNDQIKGGDGVFLGDYKVSHDTFVPAVLIGESKVVGNFNNALSDAFQSLYRVYDPKTSYLFRETEWVVALDNLIDEDCDIDEIYKRLDPASVEYNSQTMIHPVLIMYDSGELIQLEKDCVSKDELENALLAKLPSFGEPMLKSIEDQLKKYPEINSVYLHFFMIPFNDVSAFRNAMYSRLHNGEYRPKPKDKP